MRFLLDTHIAVWALTDDPRLSLKARAIIEDDAHEVFVSAASVWEIAIKHSLGRGHMPLSGAEAVRHFREAGYRLLDIRAEDAAAVEALPVLHGDPFDRLLVAQAQRIPLRLLTHDSTVAKYGSTIELV